MKVLRSNQIKLQIQYDANVAMNDVGCGCHYDVFDPNPPDCGCDD